MRLSGAFVGERFWTCEFESSAVKAPANREVGPKVPDLERGGAQITPRSILFQLSRECQGRSRHRKCVCHTNTHCRRFESVPQGPLQRVCPRAHPQTSCHHKPDKQKVNRRKKAQFKSATGRRAAVLGSVSSCHHYTHATCPDNLGHVRRCSGTSVPQRRPAWTSDAAGRGTMPFLCYFVFSSV